MNRTKSGDQKGTAPVPNSARDWDAEFSALAKRKERIFRLRLSNAVRRTSLEQLRESVVTVTECDATMTGIRTVVSGDLLGVPASLCDELANRDPQYIQQVLGAALRSSLERLSQPEMCKRHAKRLAVIY